MSTPAKWSARAGRRGRTLVASAVAVVLAVAVAIPTASQAAPRADLDQVRAQVRDLEMQAAAARERAEQARVKLAQVQDQLSTIESRRERERDEMRTRQATLGDLARAMYTGGGLDPTLEVLLAEDPAEFLAQTALIDQLSASQAAELRGIQTVRLRLAQTEAEISDREAAAQQQRDQIQAAKAEMDQRLASAEDTLDQLEEQERQRLAELERQRRLEQQQAAEAAARLVQQAGTSGGNGGGNSSGGGSSQNGSANGGGFAGGSRAAAAIQYALSKVGDPYSYSANPPSSWDCSKLTAAAWAQAGVGLTALSYTQWDQTRRVPVSEIQPGDLVFYFGSGAHHVAIYVGNGKMVSASNPSDGVELIDFLGPWYKERFSGVGRVVG